jgi:hypothetical protein
VLARPLAQGLECLLTFPFALLAFLLNALFLAARLDLGFAFVFLAICDNGQHQFFESGARNTELFRTVVDP